MLNLLRFVFALFLFAAVGSTCCAHVVIDNFDSGDEALGSSTSGVSAGRNRATGVIGEDRSGGDRNDTISNENGLIFPSADSARSGRAGHRPSERTFLRYVNASDSGNNRGGGGSSGGGSRGRRGRTGRNSADTGSDQPIMNIGSPDVGASNPGNDGGMDITNYGGGSGSPGGNGSDLEPDVNPDSPVHLCPDPPISGTPEPTALAVWAIVGCCGYGLVRFKKRLPSK